MSEFVFSRHLSGNETCDFEVGIGALFAAEQAEVDRTWVRWSVDSCREWVRSEGVRVLGDERLVWLVVDALREIPSGWAGVVEALALLHEAGVVDLVGPALTQARVRRLVAL